MLHIPLSPEKESQLRDRAAGKDVAEYVLPVVEEDLAMAEATRPDQDSPQKRRQWETGPRCLGGRASPSQLDRR